MVRVSNGVITLINFLTLTVSLCVICASLWLYIKGGSPCERSLRVPLLVVGGVVMAVSLVGLAGSCWRIAFFMWLYLIALFVLMVGLTVFTLFTIVVTNKGLGDALSRFGLESERMGHYSWWLRNNVITYENWDEIRSCMVTIKICHVIERKGDEFYKRKLSTIQSGCCKPPTYCGFELVNQTTWQMPEKGQAVAKPDCTIWRNDQAQLCFGCQTCKNAVLENIRREWRLLALFNSYVLLSITIISSIGCCALRNNQYGKRHKNYRA